jgi:hypothetical protein
MRPATLSAFLGVGYGFEMTPAADVLKITIVRATPSAGS